MQLIELASTCRHTTRLGFGCSSIMGSANRRESLRILEAAFDAGIRHFDVAPMYGYGEAEGCLGDFLRNRLDQVTVATKYGIPPAQKSALRSLARTVAGPILKAAPGLKKRLARAAAAAPSGVAHPSPKSSFTAVEAKASLARSLAELKTSRIDVWLLHEATADDLTDDALLTFLDSQVQQGIIGTFGIGSEAAKVPALVEQRPRYCCTLQYEWSVFDPAIQNTLGAPFRIHHRALSGNLTRLQTILQDPGVCRRWSDSTGADLADGKILSSLMLKAALVLNPLSIILFSSKTPAHMQANVRIADDTTLEAPALELHRLIQGEYPAC